MRNRKASGFFIVLFFTIGIEELRYTGLLGVTLVNQHTIAQFDYLSFIHVNFLVIVRPVHRCRGHEPIIASEPAGRIPAARRMLEDGDAFGAGLADAIV